MVLIETSFSQYMKGKINSCHKKDTNYYTATQTIKKILTRGNHWELVLSIADSPPQILSIKITHVRVYKYVCIYTETYDRHIYRDIYRRAYICL